MVGGRLVTGRLTCSRWEGTRPERPLHWEISASRLWLSPYFIRGVFVEDERIRVLILI